MKPPAKVDLRRDEDCPNHLLSCEMICDIGTEMDIPLDIAQVEVRTKQGFWPSDSRVRPAVRVNGVDIEPG